MVYIAAIILGLGIIGLQLLSGSSDADGDGDIDGADVDHAEDLGGFDADGDVDGDAEALLPAGKDTHIDGPGALALFISLRFWTFGLSAFGLSGALLHYLRLLDRGVVPFVAIGMGLTCGLVASWTFRALARASTSSGAQSEDALGQVGRVLVPLGKGNRGKVRIELRGQHIDYLATTDDSELEADSLVIIEEVRDGEVQVSRAPPEFLAHRDRD